MLSFSYNEAVEKFVKPVFISRVIQKVKHPKKAPTSAAVMSQTLIFQCDSIDVPFLDLKMCDSIYNLTKFEVRFILLLNGTKVWLIFIYRHVTQCYGKVMFVNRKVAHNLLLMTGGQKVIKKLAKTNPRTAIGCGWCIEGKIWKNPMSYSWTDTIHHNTIKLD